MGKNTSKIQLWVSSEVRIRLEQKAMEEGVKFNDWLRLKLKELADDKKDRITLAVEGDGFSLRMHR